MSVILMKYLQSSASKCWVKHLVLVTEVLHWKKQDVDGTTQ